ncbi:hypothetical protein IC582_014605 [Cucumis melo]
MLGVYLCGRVLTSCQRIVAVDVGWKSRRRRIEQGSRLQDEEEEEDDEASLFPRRCYGKPISKDEAERSGGERSKAERAPSTAEEFNRMATEKESKDQEEEVDEHDKVTKESGEMGKSSDPNNHINKGPNYRPCS